MFKVIRFVVGVSLRNSSDEQISDAVHKVRQISRDAGLTDERAVVHAAMAGGAYEIGGQASRRGASELRASYDSAIAYERQAQSSYSEARALRNAATAVSREGFAISGDDTYAMHNRAAEEGVSRSEMNDPAVMMDVGRRHFLEKYGSTVGGPLNALDVNGPSPSTDQMPTPRFKSGVVASGNVVQSEASKARAEISSLNQRDGVAEDGAPSTHDAAEHFVDTKRRAQGEIESREQRVAEDEQVLQDERSRRYDQKSNFNNANPGRKPELEPPLTTQWDFYTGGEEAPSKPR